MQAGLSLALEFSGALFQKGRRPFLLVFSAGTNRKERTFNDQALGLARLRAPVHRLYRKFYGERGVGIDLLQDGFSSGDQLCTWNDLIHQPNAICLLGTDRAPDRMSCSAKPFPTKRGRRCVPPAPGMSPNLTSGCPNLASPVANRMVQAIAVSQPPPRAKPFTAAITGLPRFSMRSSTVWPWRANSLASTAVTRASSAISAPAMNALSPAPVKMTPSTAESARAFSKAIPNSVKVA